MAQFPNLKIVVYHGTGFDNIDLQACKERNIIVTNTPGQNSLSVAEHVLALMLGLARWVPATASLYREKGYDSKTFPYVKHPFHISELSGKTLGLIGSGNIAILLANMVRLGFGMRVIAYDPYLKSAPEGIELTDDRMRVFKEGDYISLHIPLTNETKHSVSTKEFNAMKPTARLINCARGAIVNEEALITALKNNVIAGAGIDCSDPEPAEQDNPLFSMPNVIVTPHLAGSSDEALIRVGLMCVECVEDALAGREPKNRVV